MRIIRHLAGAAAIAVPLVGSLLGSTSALAQDAAAGREIFVARGCYGCHGYEGQGASTGPKLAPNPLPYEAIETFVRNTSAAMPPYTPAVLSDADLRNIYAFLQSIPPPPDPDSILLLQR